MASILGLAAIPPQLTSESAPGMPTLPELVLPLTAHGVPATVAGIVLLSYLLEDWALVLAALLAGNGLLPPGLAWAAAFFGIFTGDLGVYLIARLFHAPVSRWRGPLSMPSTRDLVLCRFTPGLRTPAYGWCGLSRMPLWRFSQIIFWSGLVWTLLIFNLIYQYGVKAESWLGYYKWLAIPVVAVLLWWAHGRWQPSFLRKEPVTDD